MYSLTFTALFKQYGIKNVLLEVVGTYILKVIQNCDKYYSF